MRTSVAGRLRVAVGAGALALLPLLGVAAPAAAECVLLDRDPTQMRWYVGVAFSATVISETGSPTITRPDAAPYGWQVALDVHATYRGTVPSELTLVGYSQECGYFQGQELSAGDEIIVTTNWMRPPFLGQYVLAWRRSGAAWALDSALISPHDAEPLPRAAKSATTTAQILALVAGLPATDGVVSPVTSDGGLLAAPVSVPAMLFGRDGWSRRRGRDQVSSRRPH